jgi:hypothetical protein
MQPQSSSNPSTIAKIVKSRQGMEMCPTVRRLGEAFITERLERLSGMAPSSSIVRESTLVLA